MAEPQQIPVPSTPPATVMAGAAPPQQQRREGASTTASPAANDAMRDLVQRLEAARPLISQLDPALGHRVVDIAQRARDPGQREQPEFRHQLAYLLQDLERTRVGRIEVAPALRTELTQLAGSAPGLENERMLALMRATGGLQDRTLVRDIRTAGREIGSNADQASEDVQSRIDALENKARLARRAEAAGPLEVRPERNTQPSGRQAPGEGPATQPAPVAPAAGQAPIASGGQPKQAFVASSPLDSIFSSLRSNHKDANAPWDPAPTPMRDRISAFEQQMQAGRDDATLRSAEKAGRTALDAMQAFSAGEGATVMNRIREAAKSEPGGMASVLSEMREGGRFADLRGQFNNALLDERGVSDAYDRAASSLARYGKQRADVEQVIARRPDASNLSAKFEHMDAAIGEAGASLPSRRDGKAMLDDLTKAVADMLHRAVDAVRSTFSRAPSPGNDARPSPSPSPG